MALPGCASKSGPLLLGVPLLLLLLLLGLAEARTFVSSSSATSSAASGHMHAGKGSARRATAMLAKAGTVKAAQSGTSELGTGNATSTSGQSLLRMQATWAYKYKSWTPLNPCSAWVDITCTNGYVTGIDFAENLLGGLTTDFGTLLYLTYFSAESQYIGGSLPTNIGNLRALNTFYFTLSGLSGPIPSSMGLCTLLTYLDFDGNLAMTGTIPSTLGNLGLLVELYLYYNQFTGFGEIGNAGTMPSLENLSMDYNLLTNVPSSFYKLLTLTYIYQNNNLVATVPCALSKMTQLEQFHLAYNRLVGTQPSWLSVLPGLSYADLSGNFLTGPVKSPASTTNYFEFNFFTSGDCFANNCQPASCPSQRTDGACARFCGANEPNGVCGGKGTCVPGVPLNTCICNGFRSKQQCNNNECVCT